MKNKYHKYAKKHFSSWMALGIIGWLLQSCMSMSTMQTARTTEKGELAYGLGGGYVKADISQGNSDTIRVKAPFVEIAGRYGISDRLDVGLKLTLIGSVGADVKYQLIGDHESKIAGSVGLGLAYFSIESGNSKSSMYDVMVPLYFSYHPTDWLSLYVGPKYAFRINSYKNEV